MLLSPFSHFERCTAEYCMPHKYHIAFHETDCCCLTFQARRIYFSKAISSFKGPSFFSFFFCKLWSLCCQWRSRTLPAPSLYNVPGVEGGPVQLSPRCLPWSHSRSRTWSLLGTFGTWRSPLNATLETQPIFHQADIPNSLHSLLPAVYLLVLWTCKCKWQRTMRGGILQRLMLLNTKQFLPHTPSRQLAAPQWLL